MIVRDSPFSETRVLQDRVWCDVLLTPASITSNEPIGLLKKFEVFIDFG